MHYATKQGLPAKKSRIILLAKKIIVILQPQMAG